ncbi:histone-like nucleoid-structuring protein Lsr2 [Micromonospora sp. KC213]|uniref:Lsr2 family DNA-binding protein n=1 Tax=Micromonospora sp. KC213 TaxID=2530378 RepID=UPI0014043BA8|nr:histone-like nucleoid-structuring protein Lsr2 [Micromonospora sp. KC213]
MTETYTPTEPTLTEVTEATSPATAKEVRTWAAANGHEVGQRGRISTALRSAFETATGRPAA